VPPGKRDEFQRLAGKTLENSQETGWIWQSRGKASRNICQLGKLDRMKALFRYFWTLKELKENVRRGRCQ
jgi:hypothetical protein